MLWRWLELIVAYLVSRFGEKVLHWTLEQVVDHFREHPEQGHECQVQMGGQWAEVLADDSDPNRPYFWDEPFNKSKR